MVKLRCLIKKYPNKGTLYAYYKNRFNVIINISERISYMENRTSIPNNTVMSSAIDEIRNLLSQSRQNVAVQVNQELISTYWKIGEIIIFILNYSWLCHESG